MRPSEHRMRTIWVIRCWLPIEACGQDRRSATPITIMRAERRIYVHALSSKNTQRSLTALQARAQFAMSSSRLSAVLLALIRCRSHSIRQPLVSSFLGRKAGRDLGYAAREADLNGKAGRFASYHSIGCHCLYMAACSPPHNTS
jgi:hypothetical protein